MAASAMPLAIASAIPESTKVCLKPPPAATMSRMPAIGANEEPTRPLTAERLFPSEKPNANIATTVVIVRAISGVPTKTTACPTAEASCPSISTRVRASMRNTGSSTTSIAEKNVGRFSPSTGPSSVASRSRAGSGTHLAI